MPPKFGAIIGPVTRAQTRAEKAYTVYQSLSTAWQYSPPGPTQKRLWREATRAHRLWQRHQTVLDRLRKQHNP
jgi:hypothetical protein